MVGLKDLEGYLSSDQIKTRPRKGKSLPPPPTMPLLISMFAGSEKTQSPALPLPPSSGMPRSRRLRTLLSVITLLGIGAYVVLNYGKPYSKLSKLRSHGGSGEKEANDLGFKVDSKSIKDVRNNTLGVGASVLCIFTGTDHLSSKESSL